MLQAPSLQMAWLGWQGLPGFLSHLGRKTEAPMGCLRMRQNSDGPDNNSISREQASFPPSVASLPEIGEEKEKVGSKGMPNIHKE